MHDDFYNKRISQNFKTIRRTNGLTTVDLAKILGVSQAKISYIENGKGILSARDIALLVKRLSIPVTDFFSGIDGESCSEQKNIAGYLAHYGASLLAKSSGITLKVPPFEEVFGNAIGFIEDDRIHKAFCAAFITQAVLKEINVDRIFALNGNNHFLLHRIAEESQICLQIIEVLTNRGELSGARAKRQISKIFSIAEELCNKKINKIIAANEVGSLADFVGDCLNAKK